MLSRPGSRPSAPDIDLATVRETLEYMRDDMVRARGHERVAAALATAIAEIDALAGDGAAPALHQRPGLVAFATSRFVPRR